MLEIGKASTLVIGIVCAAAGLTYVMQPGEAMVSPAAAMVPEPIVETTTPTMDEPAPVEEPQEAPEPIVVTSRTSASLDPDVSYLLLSIERQRGVEFDQAQLHLTPGAGVTVENVVGLSWKSQGGGAVADLSEGTARQEIVVVVGLHNVESANVETQVSFVEKESGAAVTAAPTAQRVATSTRDADVLLDVRIAETMWSIAEARDAAEAGNYKEVKLLLNDAQARNAEVGMSFRRIGELGASQKAIAAARAELKPKKRKKRAPKRKRIIEIIGGDRP